MIAVDQANVFATWIDVSPSRRMLAFTIAMGTLTSLIFGVGPALVSTRVSPIETMRQAGRGIAASRSRFGAAQLLVAAQVALSFVLVFAGALLVRSFVSMTQQNLGFDRGPLLVAVPDFSSGSVQRRDRVPVSDRIRDDIAALPGVRAASVSESTPFGFGLRPWPVIVPGQTPTDGELIPVSRISTKFISTLGMHILAGRDFAPAGLERPGVALVNETFQRRYLPRGQAVGQSLGIRMPGRTALEVVGVVADARDMSMREPVAPTVYIPLLPSDEPWIEIGIRTDADTTTLRRAVLDVVSRHAGGTRIEFRTLDVGLAAAAGRDRLVAWLAGGFALLALLLAALGLYGVMSYHVSRRRQEFGVRIAIGANPSRMTAMVIRESAVIVIAGLLGGVLAAVAAIRLIRSLLFGLSPVDPISISVAAAALSAICLVAGYLPARRAARIDPMAALRED
jgi:predicted permease